MQNVMNSNLIKAKELLLKGEYTCVIVKENTVYNSTERGVKPLLEFLESNTDLKGCSAADKVVGKAAAFLYILLGVKELYASVISESSLEVLKKYGIEISYGICVKSIRNRTNTGFCPMEQAVKDTDNPQDALKLITETLKKFS